MKERLKTFLKNKSNWTSLFTFVLSFVCLGISFFFTDFSYQIISVMFVLIAVENFLDKFIYMEDIKKSLSGIKPQDSRFVELKTRHECKDLYTRIQEAKHELFISGINMHSLSGYDTELLSRAKDGVKVRILVLDIYDKALLSTAPHKYLTRYMF